MWVQRRDAENAEENAEKQKTKAESAEKTEFPESSGRRSGRARRAGSGLGQVCPVENHHVREVDIAGIGYRGLEADCCGTGRTICTAGLSAGNAGSQNNHRSRGFLVVAGSETSIIPRTVPGIYGVPMEFVE